MKKLLIAASAVAIVGAAFATDSIWVKGAEKRMNAFYGFAAEFEAKAGEKAELRYSAGSIARVYVNGKFAGYGPARAADGHMRIDRRQIGALLKDGRNVVAVEVSNPAVNSFYLPEREGFVYAEVVAGNRTLAATGRDFKAIDLPREQLANRFSYQREFAEYYRMTPHSHDWRTNGIVGKGLALETRPKLKSLERDAPYPTFAYDGTFAPTFTTELTFDRNVKLKDIKTLDIAGKGSFKGFPKEKLKVNTVEINRFRPTRITPASGNGPFRLSDRNGVAYKAAHNAAGFPHVDVKCLKPGKLWLAFDEYPAANGLPDPMRFGGCVNICGWELTEPGEYALECFQPYGMGSIHVFMDGGEAEVRRVDLRTYHNPIAPKASFKSDDPSLDLIYEAAARSISHNAVDIFTDCPGRERGAYFGDTIFTGRAGDILGAIGCEQTLFANYALAPKFRDVPEGMIPMCYPGDVILDTAHWIPNFGMWAVVELRDYVERSGDREMAARFRGKADGLLKWFRANRNADGMLENLPGWVFVEWSKAQSFVDGISYLTNMTYIKFLEAFAELYGMKDCADEANGLRLKIRAQSWNGKWFRDHAVRNAEGKLVVKDDISEACQYFAMFSGVADPKIHAEHRKRVFEDLGPMRKDGVWPEVEPSNMLFGYSLRFVFLTEDGETERAIREVKACYLPMAKKTGTLWEGVNPDDGYSADHGFPSLAAWVIAKNALGLEKIDRVAKKIVLKANAKKLIGWCELRIPLSETTLAVLRVNGERVDADLPPGWKLSFE